MPWFFCLIQTVTSRSTDDANDTKDMSSEQLNRSHFWTSSLHLDPLWMSNTICIDTANFTFFYCLLILLFPDTEDYFVTTKMGWKGSKEPGWVLRLDVNFKIYSFVAFWNNCISQYTESSKGSIIFTEMYNRISLPAKWEL